MGRGTSMAAACSLGGEAPCSEPQTHAPHPQSHTAIYGFFFAASFALFAAPAPSAHSRTHTHTHTHKHTHTYIHASTHTYKRMQALVDALSSTDPDDSAVERGGVPRALPLMTCPPLHLDFCFPVLGFSLSKYSREGRRNEGLKGGVKKALQIQSGDCRGSRGFATARSSRPMKSLQRKSIHWLSDGAFDNIFWTSTRTFTQNTGQENALPGTGALLDAHAKMKLWR